jgi:hypothetical protein
LQQYTNVTGNSITSATILIESCTRPEPHT